ncbi:class I SAM-dependent methyltransferase [Propionibacteriaceae bacterium Y1685]|uniref:class I SAM-dependent methyltransferase n=1 Tax=Microlunatus sp. Y1700 TaxID=3418487 RepID=UPI003B7D9B70
MTNAGSQAAGLWDAQAATFDDEADHGLRDPDTKEAWRALLDTALPAGPSRIIDLGCGTGSLAVLLAEEGHDVVGMDFSPRMVDAARAKSVRAGVSACFLVGDVSAPNLESAAYDVVLCRHVLWALPNPADALRSWSTLLAPGGRMILVEGSWSTGGGLTAAEGERLVRTCREDVTVLPLTDPLLWGGPITDERYLLLSRR